MTIKNKPLVGKDRDWTKLAISSVATVLLGVGGTATFSNKLDAYLPNVLIQTEQQQSPAVDKPPKETPPGTESDKAGTGSTKLSSTEKDQSLVTMLTSTEGLTGLLISLLGGGTLGQAFRRRVKTKGREPVSFSLLQTKGFEKATDIPLDRNGYSDRAAYTMAELSELAYWDIEPPSNIIYGIMSVFKEKLKLTDEDLQEFKTRSNQQLDATTTKRKQDIIDILNAAGFTFLDYFDLNDVQGFICVKRSPDPYIVVAFRGSEQNVKDWLTNLEAVPKTPDIGKGEVHTGFYEQFLRVKQQINKALESGDTIIGKSDLPVYYTGHSQGGALAIIAARMLEYERRIQGQRPRMGSCVYTFGAPRVADYAFFEHMKTPVYRVVNSSDVVPRVPPGVLSSVFTLFINFISQFLPDSFFKQRLMDAHGVLDHLKNYRHSGDLRYLTDAASEKIETDSMSAAFGNVNTAHVQLLRNPNQLDTSIWFWRHIAITYGLAGVKSHSMRLYLKKLKTLVKRRNQPISPE
ncbi:MAG: lipase family protein [Aestuariibacter sp.]